MKALKKAATIFVSVILWAIILLAALFAFTTLATRDNTRVANVLGYTPMVVQSPSMSPTFEQGDLIVIRQCDPASLKEGDIITFHTIIQNEYALNTHRIVNIADVNGARSYTTKGDNNETSDLHYIGDSDIVGKYVTKVPGLGKVISILSDKVGFFLIIVLPMLAFFIYQIYHLITVSIKLKRAVAKENAAEDAATKNEALAEAERAKAEAAAALAEAKRLKEEAEALAAKNAAAAPPAEEKPAEPTGEQTV